MLYSFFPVIFPASEFYVPTFRNTLSHLRLTFEKAVRVEGDSKARQHRKFLGLHGTHPPTKTSKETVINLSDLTPDDEVYSLTLILLTWRIW